MRPSSGLGGAVAAIALLMCFDGALAWVDHCPTRCSVSGSNPGNWSAYPSLDKFKRCGQTMFYDFALYDPIDDPDVNHRVLACSSYGPDFSGLPASSLSVAAADPLDVDYEIGWWEDGYGLAASSISSLIRQTRQYLDNGHGPTTRPLILFARSGAATMGIYVGQALQKQSISDMGLSLFDGFLSTNKTIPSPSVAVQLCEPGFDSTHIFGFVAMSNATFNPIQEAIKSWAKGTCLPFNGSTKIPAQATFTKPLPVLDSPGLSKPTHGNSTAHLNRTLTETTSSKNQRRAQRPGRSPHARLQARADCSTIQVVPGDSCAALATRCGVSGDDFTRYNPGSDFCSKLVPKQHVCCSAGDLPDFRPHKNSDGSCASYHVLDGDNCGDIAAANSLEISDLEDFNKNTWGWNGCARLLIDTVMCLSDGDPPFPAPMANALCGPQVPGTEKPTNGTKFADLNPCPLNACCDVWGQCGITKEFCVDTGTGAPGTAKAGTNGCISNCGTTIVKGSGDGSQRVAYYQGYGLSRDCLFQDASQIDTSKYTHIHFGFGTLTPDFQVETGDILSSYEFEQFSLVTGAKRILSFGGWAFSTEPATYSIFRQGVTPGNRFLMASSIASFIIDNELDGVDIDWEYPGAPDIPGIPPGGEDDGLNFLFFLVILKNLLGDRSVSIAAPSSYWYLKQYPIAEISKIVDYIVFMTYDLHGQWDAGNSYSQEGCDTGNCLRSQVNLTETQTSLAMITKAGVAAEKVVVGVTSYGRSFQMAEAGCYGTNCVFTGDSMNSQAAAGVCTGAPGILANAEIADIIAGTDSTGLKARSSRVTASYIDPTSNSRVLVYDDVQWVDYMDDAIKTTRQALYSAWGFAGTTDWASDLQEFHDSPVSGMTWSDFINKVKMNEDPKLDESRHGNWTSFDCSSDYVVRSALYTPAQQWSGLDADGAWNDCVRIYANTDAENNRTLTFSVATTLQINQKNLDCGQVGPTSHCSNTIECLVPEFNSPLSGPAAQLIWSSFAQINNMYSGFWTDINAALTVANDDLALLQVNFAPYPPPPDPSWTFILIDLITLGATAMLGPAFNSFLSELPVFAAGAAADNAKDTAMTLTGSATTIAKDAYKPSTLPWDATGEAKFTSFLGHAVEAWRDSVAMALKDLFDGTKAGSIETLGNLIANGQLISDGTIDAGSGTPIDTAITHNIQKTIFTFAIPQMWNVSKAHAFVLDSGYGCDEADSKMGTYIDEDTMKYGGACIGTTKYYLVQPKGDASYVECDPNPSGCTPRPVRNQFSMAPGLDSLGGGSFGDVTVSDLIAGAVKTYVANGEENGGPPLDPTFTSSLSDLVDGNLVTPGLIRIPVCSAESAYRTWDSSKPSDDTPTYPCNIPPGKIYCDASVNITSGAVTDSSPLTSDCLGIIQNIQDDASTSWTTECIVRNTHRIAYAGSCGFRVQGLASDGNVDFLVGGQDLINLIHTVVSQFPGERVEAEGYFNCKGNIKSEPVHWHISPA